MELFPWKDEYSVEVAEIDEEHKKLVDLTNQLYSAMKQGKSKDVIDKILRGLADYTVEHFSDEEGLMKKAGYAGLEEHQKVHQEFVAKVETFIKDFESGKLLLSIEILSFLRDWLIQHIMGTDRKYIETMHEHGIR